MAGRLPPDGSNALLHAIEDENDAFIEYDGEEEEEDEDSASEDEEDDGDEEYTGDDEPEAVVPPPPAAPRVSPSRPATLSEDREASPRTRGGGETTTSLSQDSEWSRSEIEGLFCPICMEAWSNGGDHQVCCLPCGHLFGASCIKKWLQQRKNSGKCPQCNRKSTLKDVRVIYAQQIVAIDQEIQKKVRSLEAKCASLQEKNNDWQKREGEWRKREADLNVEVHQLRERKSNLEHLLANPRDRLVAFLDACEDACEGITTQAMIGRKLDLEFCGQESSSSFILQKELQIDGAKLFDVDASSQIGIIAQRLSGMGGTHVLSKMSLIAPHGRENIALPFNTKAVRDLHVAPHGRLALIASLGKKLSVISMESNNTVLSYDLPAAAWSCSWDLNSSHYVYAGLQNGMLLVFDIRQTLKPVESVVGLTCNPIHTMYSLLPDSTLPSGVRSLLTASSGGLYQWNFGATEERTCLIPGSENQGVCIALAYCPRSSHIVASFRPKVEISNNMIVSQPSLSSVSSVTGKGLRGTHTLYKALGNSCYQNLGSTCVSVPDVRLPKSAIICDNDLQFASTNEVTREVVLHKLPSFMVAQYLKSQVHPIRDVKYTHDLSSGLLSCLSEDRLQLFSRKTL